MTPERWQQVKQVFNSAIRFRPDERESFLSDACSGDEALRSEVESLIASHEQSGQFIDEPAYQHAGVSFIETPSELHPGQTIESYEVINFISRGGMGEVYLAHDRRLNRKVALKLLPAAFTKDGDRLRRFEQEARAASALNHPNILTIYEIRQTPSAHLIATEFVEGETLRQRLAKSRLSLSESLGIAIQIADALTVAHKAKIVHRDIKPENVMLRPDGYIKVLDFGLAKLNEQANGAVAAEAPTIQVMTGAGVVMGTAGYMSPEQARGQAVDDRSDIFSLGAVIYEMLARRKPFEGETPSDTLAAILKSDPIPLQRLLPEIPAELVRIVNKALRKDREERYQVVKDLLLDLKALRDELQYQAKAGNTLDPFDSVARSDSSLNATKMINPVETVERSALSSISQSISIEIKRHKVGSAITFAVALLLLGVGVFGLYKYVNRPLPVEHFSDVGISRLTISGNAIDATISPDGKYVVYVLSESGKQSLFIRQVSAANDKIIVAPAPVGFFGIGFSPDGTELFYAVKSNLDLGTLYRIPVLGGTPIKVLEKIDTPVSFSPDGSKFVLMRGNFPKEGESSLVIADVNGTNERILSTKRRPQRFSPVFFTGPSWSPDGKLIAATVSTLGGSAEVFTYSVADGSEKQLSSQSWNFAARVMWLPDMTGLLVVAGNAAQNAQVWHVQYPEGKTRKITNDLSTYRALGIAADGKKFSSVEANGLVNVWMVPDGDAARAVSLPVGNIGFYSAAGTNVSWTPEGKIIFSSTEAGAVELWTMDPDGQNKKQLTANGAFNFSPQVSPDGRYIVYASNVAGRSSIWRMDVSGSNQTKLTDGSADLFPSFTPDGQWVVYSVLDGPAPSVWKVPVNGGSPVRLIEHIATNARVSPDGKLIAYTYPESADPYAPPNRLSIVQVDGQGEPRTYEIQPTAVVSTVVEWSADSRSILYTVNQNNVTNIWSQPVEGGPTKQITDFKDYLMSGFAYSGDGKQLVCTRGRLTRDAVLISDLK